MTIEYEQTYQLRTGDFDTYAHLQPASILDIFQDAAGANADRTPGMTMEDAAAGTKLLWVITRLKYEVLKTPALHEQVITKTWPLAPSRVGFQREYTIKSFDGDLLVKGTSEWVLMDAATRSFVSARDVYNGPDDFSTEKNFEKKVRKLRDFEPADEGRLVTPTFTDIDVNGHVNNTKYASYVLDALNPSEDEVIRTLQIDYRHEVRCGENVRVHLMREDGAVTALGAGEDGTCKFMARIEFA